MKSDQAEGAGPSTLPQTDDVTGEEVPVEITVYVVERGCYSDRYVDGVYGSLAEAKEGKPHDPPGSGEVEWNPQRTYWSRTDPDGWTESASADGSYQTWSNGLDWDDLASITPHVVKVRLGAPNDNPASGVQSGGK